MRYRLAFLLALILPCSLLGAPSEPIVVDGLHFGSKIDFLRSDYFQQSGLRCGTPTREQREALYGSIEGGVPGDCSASSTNPTTDYDPTVVWRIPVVVHILMNDACTSGVISDAMVDSQIDILNEDFQALAGTNGAPGNDNRIEFYLATTDPGGASTTGITRDCNTTWFNDGGSYWNTLAWDPHNYLNIYTVTISGGVLGYVPFLPADGGGTLVGDASDRVVMLWTTFGRNGPYGPPYDQGRTSTHEVGHYMGMEHTFSGGCGDPNVPGCYSTGDLICDTNNESAPVFSPCNVGASSSCGSVDPSDNYMDYSDDLCMNKFTIEQGRRIRCSLEFYRPSLYEVGAGEDIFADGFETGDMTGWDSTSP